MLDMDLNKLEKFNFFKRSKKDKQDIKASLIYFSKRLLRLSGFFVIAPALLYLLLKLVPELKYSLPALLDSVSSQSLNALVLTLYGTYMAGIILKETWNASLDGQELGKEYSNIFIPFLFAAEVGLVLGCLPSIWSLVWHLIR